MNWLTISSFGQSGPAKFAPIWLAIVPFVMGLAGDAAAHRFGVPLNFQLFYFASVFFGFGWAIYAWRCPSIIKHAPNYGAFQQGQHSEVELRKWFHEVASEVSGRPDPELILQYISVARGVANITHQQLAEKLAGVAGPAILNPFWEMEANTRLPNAHDFAVNTAKDLRRWSRAAATLAYLIGYLLVGAVFLHNGVKVVQYYRGTSEEATGSSTRLKATNSFIVSADASNPSNNLPHEATSPSEKSMKNSIWITYAWVDNADGNFDFLVQELSSSGLNVRFDRRALIPGQRLWDQIAQQISAPELTAWAFLVTPTSLHSEACREELAYALDRAISSKGRDFPIIGLLHGVSVDDLPPALKVRLCIDLRAPNYVEQVKAAVEKRSPDIVLKKSEPITCLVYCPYQGDPNLVAFEFKPRFGELHNWRIAFPKEFKPVTYGSGPPNGGGVSAVRFDFLEGVGLTFEGIPMNFIGCSNPIGPSTSAYIVFPKDQCPLALHFGVTDSPTGIAHSGTFFSFQRK